MASKQDDAADQPFAEYLEQKEEAARETYKKGTRSENPRRTDINLGKLRAYRDAREEYLKRERPDESTSHPISVIDQHPLPTTAEEAEEVVRINPMFEGVDDAPHPDTFHDRYQNVLAENHEWRIFRTEMYPYSNTVFVWNHQLGFGFRVPDGEGQFRSLVETMMRAAEEVA